MDTQITVYTIHYKISGLNLDIIVYIDENNVILTACNPYYLFTPPLLPYITTNIVKEFNLNPQTKWFFLVQSMNWTLFEFFIDWDSKTKKFTGIPKKGGPYLIKVNDTFFEIIYKIKVFYNKVKKV